MRHGESVANETKTITNLPSDSTPLTELGREQANKLLEIFQQRRIIAIYTCPLTRARETAEIIAAAFGLEVEIDDALREPYCFTACK